MAIIKCKMCGGELILIDGASTAECEFCGSVQTIPNLDDEKKLIQFERAERLRKQCEFDKAAGIYETIVADYRQEAEAYWGLVLCKYGIEYVDDPATGKKIPTCHRSSFDSIMEDGDFELALENADVMARKVYREEAKQIEEIRKGVIAVSVNEEPYDIFICYKETDANGDRTLDSVLAQDIYDALTDKGYRVFFSRITLEDKLGQEYEPYIFAALNSAKIMLAFGTDYEYFNAVWVKNEWSRFLKLMAADKSKHLIPCFKGIDAYDMPKEFARLQAQDLGKVGAVQDILRGVEKLLPRKENNTVSTQQSNANNVTALLKRGYMALNDGDWNSAEGFFEDVLNQNAECAEAYIGKALVQEKCVSLDMLVKQRLKKTSSVSCFDKYKIPENKSHIDAAVEKYKASGFWDEKAIRREYTYDLTYTSEVGARKDQKNAELTAWKLNKNLSRAEQFASGETAEQIASAKNQLLSVLAQRITKAEEDRWEEKARLEKRYSGFLKIVDEEMDAKLQEAEASRKKQYDRLVQVLNGSNDTVKLTNAADQLEKMGDYLDSRTVAKQCREKARGIIREKKQLRDAQEAEKRRIAAEMKAAEKAKVAEERRRKEQWRNAGLCQHCGGALKGFFTKKCNNCGKSKDY